MDHPETDTADYSNIKLFRGILKRYMNLNYSRAFLKSGKYHLVNSSVTKYKATGVFIRCTGDSFTVEFDLKKNTIKHIGSYAENRKTPINKILRNSNSKLKL